MSRTPRTVAGVAYACDRLIIGRGGHVIRIGRGRNADVQSPALPERRYHIEQQALWWWPRGGRGTVTADQFDFAVREFQAGSIVGAGDELALRQVLAFLSYPDRRQAAGTIAFDHLLAVHGRRANEPTC